jgi:hypothetical protein
LVDLRPALFAADASLALNNPEANKKFWYQGYVYGSFFIKGANIGGTQTEML